MKTKAEMEADYGAVPFAIPKNGHYIWTICRAHADVTWVTDDRGATWSKKSVVWADERNRRDEAAVEAQRIQREES